MSEFGKQWSNDFLLFRVVCFLLVFVWLVFCFVGVFCLFFVFSCPSACTTSWFITAAFRRKEPPPFYKCTPRVLLSLDPELNA